MLANQANWAPLYSAIGLVIVAVVGGLFANHGKKIEKKRTDPENTSLEVSTMRSVIETVNAERAIEREERKKMSIEAAELRQEVSDLHDELRTTFDDVRLALTILRFEVRRLRGMLTQVGVDPGPEVELPSIPRFLMNPDEPEPAHIQNEERP